MPGISVDIETQLLIDRVIKGSKLDSSVDELLEDINKKAKRKGISPIDEKTFSSTIKIMEREYERMVKKTTVGGMSASVISDAIKSYERIELAAEELRKRFLKKHIELTENQSKAMARRILEYQDSINEGVRKKRQEAIIEPGEKSRKELLAMAKAPTVIPQVKASDMKPSKVMFEVVKKQKPVEWMERPKDIGFMGWKHDRKYALDDEKITQEQKKKPAGSSMMGMGIVAGVSAAITYKLLEAIQDMAKKSGILSKTFEFVGNILGLLVDLILLPFIPILAFAMISLVKVVMFLGKEWSKFLAWLFPKVDPKTGEPEGQTEGQKNAPKVSDMLTLVGIDLSKIDLGNDFLNALKDSFGKIDLPTFFAGVAGIIIAGLVTALLIAAGVSAGWAVVATAILAVLFVLITTALVKLAYQAGDDFAEAMRNIFGAENLWIGIVGTFSGAAVGAIVGGILGAIAGAFLGPAGSIAGAALGATFGAIIGAWITENLITVAAEAGSKFIDSMREVFGAENLWAGVAAVASGAGIGAIVGGIIGSLAGPVGTVAGAAIGAVLGEIFTENLLKAAYDLGYNFQGWINTEWNPAMASLMSSLGNLGESIKNALKGVANGFIWAANQILGALRNVPGLNWAIPADIPYLNIGGLIEKTGVAVVHKGETIVPSGKTPQAEKTATNNYFNFYGLTDSQLQDKIRSTMRQDATRYVQ